MNRSEITDADLLAALLPDSPADLMAPQAAPAVPAPSLPAGPLTVAYQTRPDGTLAPFYMPVPTTPALPAVRHDAGPLVPRWAVGTAIVAPALGGGVYMLAKAAELLGAAASALAAGASAALPLLVVAGVVIAAMVGRKKSGKGAQVVQTVTQTITQSVRVGD